MGTQALRRGAKQMAVAFPHDTSKSLGGMLSLSILIVDDFSGMIMTRRLYNDRNWKAAGEQGVSVIRIDDCDGINEHKMNCLNEFFTSFYYTL